MTGPLTSLPSPMPVKYWKGLSRRFFQLIRDPCDMLEVCLEPQGKPPRLLREAQQNIKRCVDVMEITAEELEPLTERAGADADLPLKTHATKEETLNYLRQVRAATTESEQRVNWFLDSVAEEVWP